MKKVEHIGKYVKAEVIIPESGSKILDIAIEKIIKGMLLEMEYDVGRLTNPKEIEKVAMERLRRLEGKK